MSQRRWASTNRQLSQLHIGQLSGSVSRASCYASVFPEDTVCCVDAGPPFCTSVQCWATFLPSFPIHCHQKWAAKWSAVPYTSPGNNSMSENLSPTSGDTANIKKCKLYTTQLSECISYHNFYHYWFTFGVKLTLYSSSRYTFSNSNVFLFIVTWWFLTYKWHLTSVNNCVTKVYNCTCSCLSYKMENFSI